MQEEKVKKRSAETDAEPFMYIFICTFGPQNRKKNQTLFKSPQIKNRKSIVSDICSEFNVTVSFSYIHA